MPVPPTVLAVVLAATLTATGVPHPPLNTGHQAGPSGAATASAAARGAPAPAFTAGPVAAARPGPRVRAQALKGVDRKVLAQAPTPDHSGMSAMAGEGRVAVRPAVAATLKLKDPAALLAVTADAQFDAGSHIQVRVKQAGRWSAWNELSASQGHGPDPGSAEARLARVGSDPLMAVRATKAQVRIDTPDGRVPRGTELTSVSSPTSAADATMGPHSSNRARAVSQASLVASATPSIITRTQWGADESWRGRQPWYTDNVRVGFVHHTASSSKYSQAQAVAQVRAIYAYHTRSLGHSDIDYNFVVDRFGRLYEGRAGGMDRAVLGGHTAGFNEHSFAVVALGNFQSFKPTPSQMAAIRESTARLFAWKLALSGVNPAATQKLISAGYIRATRFNRGTVAELPAVSSHQMVNFTACPGLGMQAQLPAIRRLAASYSNVVISAPSPPVPAFEIGERSAVAVTAWTNRAVTWRADVLSPCSDVPLRSFSGRAAAASSIPVTWDLRDSTGRAVLPAQYTIRMTGKADDATPVPATSSTLTIAPAAGGSWGPCGNASRVIADTPAATSVLWGRIAAPSSRIAVVTGYSDAGAAALAAGLVAAPLARKLRAPLLVTPAGSLSPAVSAEIRRRGVREVLVVGSTSVVSKKVARSLAGLRVKVTRLSGPDAAGTARAVSARMGRAGAPIQIDPIGAPGQAVARAALAAARGVPVGIASARAVPGTAAAVPDPVAAARRLADAYPRSAHTVMILPANQVLATSAVAASVGAPVLLSHPVSPSPEILSFFAARPGIRSANTPASPAALGDRVLGAASRVILGVPWAPGGISVVSGLTANRKLGRANAGPEPVRVNRQITVKAKVRGKYTDGKWRAIPAGVPFDVQFKAKGKKRYRIVASGLTQAGRARLRVPASKSGRWRIVVTGKASSSDYVAVRR